MHRTRSGTSQTRTVAYPKIVLRSYVIYVRLAAHQPYQARVLTQHIEGESEGVRERESGRECVYVCFKYRLIVCLNIYSTWRS